MLSLPIAITIKSKLLLNRCLHLHTSNQPPRHRPRRDTTLHYIASIHSPEAVPMFLRLWTNISSVIQYLWEMVVLIEGFQATSYLVGSRLTFLKTRKLNTSSAQDWGWRLQDAEFHVQWHNNRAQHHCREPGPGPAEISIFQIFQ